MKRSKETLTIGDGPRSILDDPREPSES